MQVHNAKSTPNLNMDKYGHFRQFSGHHGGANKPYRDVNATPPPPVSRGRHGGVYNISNSHSGLSHGPSSLGGSGTVYEKDSRRNSASFGNSPFSSSYGQGYTNNARSRESFSYKGRDRDSFSSNKGRDRDSFSSGISYRPYERSNYNRSNDYENLCDISTDYQSSIKYQSRSSPDLSRNSRDSIASDYSVRTLINVSPEPPAVPPRPSNVDMDTGYAPAPPVRDTSSSYGRYNHNHDRNPSWPPEAHVDQMQKPSLNATIGTESGSEIRKPRPSYPFQASYNKPQKPEPESQVVENDSLTSPKKPKFQTDIIHHAKVAKVTNIENELDFVKPYPSLDPKSETEVRNLYNSPPSYLYPSYESGAHKYCDRDFRIPSPPKTAVAPPTVQRTQMNPPTVESLDQKQLDQMIGEYVESYKAHHKKKSSSGYHDNTQVPRPNILSMASSNNAAANQKVTVSVIRSPNDPHNAKDPSRAFVYCPKPHYSTSTQTDDLSPIEQTAVPLRAVPMEATPDDVFTDDAHNKSTNTDPDVPVFRNHRRSHQGSISSRPTSFQSDSSRPTSSQTDFSSRPTSYAEYDMDKGVVTDRQSVSSERQSVTSDRQSVTSELQSAMSDHHSISTEPQSYAETEKPPHHPFKPIHDYSPSTAPLLRRLSEEYFNQRDANVRQLNDHPIEQTVPEGKELNLDDRRVISKKGPIVKRPIRFEEIDIPPPPWERGKRNDKRRSLDIPSKESDDLQVSMETGKQVEVNENEAAPKIPQKMMVRAGPNRMSMKKAYGIGDDSDIHPEPIFKISRSTSNIPEEPLKEDSSDFMKRSESESQSLKAMEKKLKRSSSEQFRPIKERLRKSGRQGSDPDSEHCRKSSDCSDRSDQQAPVSGHNRWQNLSDPASQSSRSSTPQQSNEKRSNSDPMQKQLPYLSVSGKMKTPTSEGKRRVGSDPFVLEGEPDIITDTKRGPITTRSHGAYGSQDSGYRSDRTSDPQLKNLQQWGYVDKRAPYIDNIRSEEVYMAERSNPQTRMASTLPPGMDAPNFSKMSEYAEIDKQHVCSVSQDQGSLSKDQVNLRNRHNDHGDVPPPRPERPKSFGDQKFERLHPSAHKSSPDTTNRKRPDSLASHTSLASPSHHRDRGYGFDGESQRQRREHAEDGSRNRNSYRLSYDKGLRHGDDAERLESSTTVDGSPTKRGPVWKRSKTPENVQKTKEVDQSPYADVSRLSASVKGGDQAPPASSSTGKGDQQKYEPYTPDSSEQVEQKPPLLPPRLYRTKNTILQEKPLEGKDRQGHTHGNYDNIGEVEPTDAYADMLRQQAMRFTQPQSMNVLKYKSKPHNETVVTSRPVKPVERYQSVPESQPIKYHPAEPLTCSKPTDLDKLQELRPLSTSSPKPTDENRISEPEPKRKQSPSKSMPNLNYRASSPEFFFPPPPEEPPPPSKNFSVDTSEDDLSLPLPPPPSETEMPSDATVEPVRQVQREFAKPLTKYSSESYISNRSNNIPRRGYGGNYRRSDSGGFSASLAAQISPTDPHGDYVNLADPEPERKQPSPPKQLSYSPNSAFTNQITPRSAMENGEKEDYRRMPVSSQVAKFEKGDSLFKPIDHAPTYEAKSVIAKNVLQLTGKFGGSKESLNRSMENLSRCSDGVSKSSESLDSVGGKAGDRRLSTPDRRPSTPNRREFPGDRKQSVDIQDENVPPRTESPGRVRIDSSHMRKFSADVVIIEKTQNNRTPPAVPVKDKKQETPNAYTENTHEVETPDRNFDSPDGIRKEKIGMNADMIQNSPDTPFMNQLRSSASNERTVFREVTPPGEQNVTPQSQRAPQPPLPSSVHVRQKSQEEIECDEVIAKLANELKEKDKKLSEVISPPNTYKLPQDYYGDIFDEDVAGVSRRLVISPDRGAGSPAVRTPNQDAQETSESPLPPTSPYWVSPSAANLERKIREDGNRNEMMDNLGDDTASLDRKKEELIERIETKLKILKEAKQSLSNDIQDNNTLGKQVTKIVEQKLENPKELDKYKSYVDELDKIMHLLLKLAGRLARAENAVLSLPDDAAERERLSLISKRDKLSEQHEDAKKLKEGIDKRSKQVATYLRKDLTEAEFADYEVFVKMKSKLIMEEQEIEDKIILGEEQLKALSKSMLHCRDPDDLDFYLD